MEWYESKSGSDETGHVTSVRGKLHDYLAMNLNFLHGGKLKFGIEYYIKNMLEEFPYEVKANSTIPWNDKFLKATTIVTS